MFLSLFYNYLSLTPLSLVSCSLLLTVQQKATRIIRPSNKESREEGFKMCLLPQSPCFSIVFLNAAQVGLMLFSRSLKPDVNSLFTVQ